MLTDVNQYLINDIKELRYDYIPQLGCWRSVSVRQNAVNKIVTVARIKIKKQKTIKAYVQQFVGPARNNKDVQLKLEDTRSIKFKDKKFASYLANLKNANIDGKV